MADIQIKETTPTHPDDIAVDEFATAMKIKLAKQRAKGYGGWEDPAQCPVERLATMLVDHIGKGDPVDVGNFSMMLHHREGGGQAMASVGQRHPDADITARVTNVLMANMTANLGRSMANSAEACARAVIALFAEREKAAAELAAMQGGGPDGWRLVPVDPTEEMIDAAMPKGFLPSNTFAERWSRALAAAPQPPASPLACGRRRTSSGKEPSDAQQRQSDHGHVAGKCGGAAEIGRRIIRPPA